MQLSRLLVSYPGMKELLRQMLETAPLSDRRIIALAQGGERDPIRLREGAVKGI